LYHERFCEEPFWQGTRSSVFTGTGLHPDAYTNTEFFEVEQDRLYERAWVVVGCVPEVADVGRLLVRRVGQRSVIVVRGADGKVRAFLNSCRHRGTELAEADCSVNGTIRCPYHRWGYGLDGQLRATPFFDEVERPDFDRANFGLFEVRVATWGPLIFVCLSDATPPLLAWLGDLPQRLAGYKLDEWSLRREQTLEIEANWKLITENYQEYYHLTWIHPELSKVSRVEDHSRFQGPGMYVGQTTTPVSSGDNGIWLSLPQAGDLDGSDSVSGRHIALFPNVMMSVLPNHLAVLRIEPTAPGHTRETLSLLLPPDAVTGGESSVAQADFDETAAFWIDLNSEDIDICERGQRGLSRGAVPPGPLAPRFEEPLNRFHNMVADMFCVDDLAGYLPPRGDCPGDDERYGTSTNPNPPSIDVG